MAAMAFTGKLLEKIARSSDTSSYRFSRPPEYSFVAGQWFTLTIPSDQGPLDHHFSHADSPTESFVELTTRLTGSDYKNALDSLAAGRRGRNRGSLRPFPFRLRRPQDRLSHGRHRHHPRPQHAALPRRHER